MGENFEVELTMDDGSKKITYTRNGEFHFDLSGFVTSVEVNGETVVSGETGNALLPSGTEISIDLGSPSAVEFDDVAGGIGL